MESEWSGNFALWCCVSCGAITREEISSLTTVDGAPMPRFGWGCNSCHDGRRTFVRRLSVADFNGFIINLRNFGGGCYASTAGNLRRTKNWLHHWQTGLPDFSERLGGLRKNDVEFLVDELAYLKLALAMEAGC
jgi:hypothetical protein